MNYYCTQIGLIRGSRYETISKVAVRIYNRTVSNSRRKPYVRSKYFNKKKIFLDLFWMHLYDKNKKERMIRLRYFELALDLIKNSQIAPTLKMNPNKPSELLYRFYGMSLNKQKFVVQIKENIQTGQRWFMSVFPIH